MASEILRRAYRSAVLIAACGLLGVPLAGAADRSLHVRSGETIYREGLLPAGTPLEGERAGGLPLEGAAAACMNCHRRSGLGMKEGRQSIPPIAGRYLFHARSHGDDLDLPFVESMRADRDPYTEQTLGRAIREGIGADGKPLGVLMPHFALDDRSMDDIIAYLKTLAPNGVPGVSSSTLSFATIFTPDSDPKVREGVRHVLEQFFADKNHYTRAESPRLHSSHRLGFKVNLHWDLQVWELEGAPDSWETQLRAKLAAHPVYAVISGVGGSTWAPVHHFCEASALPCLFPIVDLPVDAHNDLANLYFSKGVLLEAALIAQDLKTRSVSGEAHRVVQFYRANDVGQAAAQSLATAFNPASDTGIEFVNHMLDPGAGTRDLAAALHATTKGDVLVLWLRPGDIAALGQPPAGMSRAYMSGRMGGLEEAPLPLSWRTATHIAYPFNLPDRRRVQVDYPLGWFRIRNIPVVALQAQADSYLACIILSETLNHMADTFQRDYLVERIEEGLEHRILTGYYPRLALAPGQSFASKGGFIAHFTEKTGGHIAADGEWITP